MKTRLGAFLLRPPGAREAVRRFRLAEGLGFDAAFATHVNGQEALTMCIQIGVGVDVDAGRAVHHPVIGRDHQDRIGR